MVQPCENPGKEDVGVDHQTAILESDLGLEHQIFFRNLSHFGVEFAVPYIRDTVSIVIELSNVDFLQLCES